MPEKPDTDWTPLSYPTTATTHTKWQRDYVAIVTAIDYHGHPLGRWAFAIFEEGDCVAGKTDPAWSLKDAKFAADSELELLG